MKLPLPILFALGTALCWGLYGPVLGKARLADPDHSPFKPYVGIGVAYIVWAILGGLAGMRYKGDSFTLTGAGGILGLAFVAGTLGAWGALNLTLAMFAGGAKMAHVVMPVVFGGAVTVSALVSVATTAAGTKSNPWLWVGIIGIFVCTVLVAANTPHGGPKKPSSSATPSAESTEPGGESPDSSVP